MTTRRAHASHSRRARTRPGAPSQRRCARRLSAQRRSFGHSAKKGKRRSASGRSKLRAAAARRRGATGAGCRGEATARREAARRGVRRCSAWVLLATTVMPTCLTQTAPQPSAPRARRRSDAYAPWTWPARRRCCCWAVRHLGTSPGLRSAGCATPTAAVLTAVQRPGRRLHCAWRKVMREATLGRLNTLQKKALRKTRV